MKPPLRNNLEWKLLKSKLLLTRDLLLTWYLLNAQRAANWGVERYLHTYQAGMSKGSDVPRDSNTVSQLSIQTKAFFSTGLERDAELHREKIWCHRARTSKVLRMQPSDGEYDIIRRSYMSEVRKAFEYLEVIYGRSAMCIIILWANGFRCILFFTHAGSLVDTCSITLWPVLPFWPKHHLCHPENHLSLLLKNT